MKYITTHYTTVSPCAKASIGKNIQDSFEWIGFGTHENQVLQSIYIKTNEKLIQEWMYWFIIRVREAIVIMRLCSQDEKSGHDGPIDVSNDNSKTRLFRSVFPDRNRSVDGRAVDLFKIHDS